MCLLPLGRRGDLQPGTAYPRSRTCYECARADAEIDGANAVNLEAIRAPQWLRRAGWTAQAPTRPHVPNMQLLTAGHEGSGVRPRKERLSSGRTWRDPDSFTEDA